MLLMNHKMLLKVNFQDRQLESTDTVDLNTFLEKVSRESFPIRFCKSL